MHRHETAIGADLSLCRDEQRSDGPWGEDKNESSGRFVGIIPVMARIEITVPLYASLLQKCFWVSDVEVELKPGAPPSSAQSGRWCDSTAGPGWCSPREQSR